mgnify:CR=1 FL=1
MKISNLIKERKKAEERRRKIDSAKKFAIGSAIGVLGGILFAPKSGKDIRKDIVDKTKETAEVTKNTIKDVQGKVKEEVKNRISEVKERKMFEIEINNDASAEEKNEDKENAEKEINNGEVAGE